ncbi:MAG TPA: hypothetical protein VFN76_06355 [Candidatus Limnocylindria bacterium]|nr:hypothetical protein [Candidatus Limnocylindria bacterium]
MWWQIVAALIGLVLMAAPDGLDLPEATGTLVNILAPISAAFAIIAASEITRGLRWLSALAAAAMAIGVVVLGAPMPQLAVVAGGAAAMAALATRGERTTARFGGGWSALL